MVFLYCHKDKRNASNIQIYGRSDAFSVCKRIVMVQASKNTFASA